MSLKHIKLKIQSVKKTAKVTRAMEAVSAVKMRKAQERALGSRGYARAAMRILSQVSGSLEKSQHPLVVEREVGKTVIVIVTSDKGLAGSLNASVLKMVQSIVKEQNLSASDVEALCIGRRGLEFAQRRGFKVVYSEINVSDNISIEYLQEVATTIINMQTAGVSKKVYIVYTNFISTFEQKAVARKILPLSQDAINQMVTEIVPKKGKFSQVTTSDAKISGEYLIEPDQTSVFNMVLPYLANIAVFHALAESKASEHSARMVAMKNATDKAKEIAHELTLEFNKKRQAAITAEVSEITSGMEAMK